MYQLPYDECEGGCGAQMRQGGGGGEVGTACRARALRIHNNHTDI